MIFTRTFRGQLCHICGKMMIGDGLFVGHPEGGTTSAHIECYEQQHDTMRAALVKIAQYTERCGSGDMVEAAEDFGVIREMAAALLHTLDMEEDD